MKYIKLMVFIILSVVTSSCTDDFDNINTSKTGFTTDEVSAKFFLTSSQINMYSPDRWFYWRSQLIYGDRYAGHYTFGHNGSWWDDGLGYNFDLVYTDESYLWMSGLYGSIFQFAQLTDVGAEFENQYMYAMSLIMKGLYFQMYTDTYGMVPFSEIDDESILTPKYDTQKVVYKGIIADLDAAMATIGSAERTGVGVEDVGANDIYCGGDLQKWKKLANTLKLRIGMRALGATGDDFATAAINSALSAPLLDEGTGSAVMIKDLVVGKWTSSSYGDIWHDFGGGASKWTMGATLINMLIDTEDPRLSKYANPVAGGSFIFIDDGDSDYQERLDFIIAALDASSASYSVSTTGAETTIEVPAGQYIGQPTRINSDTWDKGFVRFEFFSWPSDAITTPRGVQVDSYPEIILTSAEAYFLQAEAAVRGMGSGNAQSLFEQGISEAMKLWDVGSGAIATYIADQAAADISMGTLDEKLEKIAHQRWLVSYTDSYEAWAVVRDTGYPASLAAGVSNFTIFAGGNLNGDYPQRMRYGTSAQSNPNYAAAISAQGPDVQGTKLWYAK